RTMHEKRYVRFASIAGIERRDIPVAGEVWLEELSRSCWADRDILKLATLFMRYMRRPEVGILDFSAIEGVCGLDRAQVANALRLMVTYGAAEAFDAGGEALKVSLNLSVLQRLRVLEIRRRFADLSGPRDPDGPWSDSDAEHLALVG